MSKQNTDIADNGMKIKEQEDKERLKLFLEHIHSDNFSEKERRKKILLNL